MPRTPFGAAFVFGVAVVAAVLLVPSSGEGQRSSRFDREAVNGRDAVAREILVKFRDGIGPPGLAALRGELDADNVQPIGRTGVWLVRSRALGARTLAERLARRGDVVYAEPNFVLRLAATPDDPGFPELWGLNFIQAPQAWDQSIGSTANVVAVLDTGIDYTHPDLAVNIWSAPAPFSVTVGGQTINCAAGTHGFNAITRTCDPMDDHYHGTHVAGTIGAVGNNGVGVTGVNWTARLMALKFFDSEGSATLADAIASVEFAIAVKQTFAATGDANVRVLSNSWVMPDFSQALFDEMNAAGNEDMLVVAGAGNSGTNNDTLPFYPASFDAPHVISVAATTFTDDLAYFSNYGASSVDLAAPGDFILSTTPGGSYQYLSGTSMATPHVSGAAALVLSQCALDTVTLKETLLGTADPLPGLVGMTVTGGRLNVNSALHACTGPPDVPVLTARGGDMRVTLSWPPPLGAIRYNVKRSLSTGGPYAPLASDINTTTYVDTAVMNGTTYYYVVAAENALGESGDSNEASATPSIPSDLLVTSFTAPAAGSEGASIPISVTTKNQGAGLAQASTTRFYLSTDIFLDPLDTPLTGAQSVGALAPGGEASASLTIAIPPNVATGKHYLIALADADDVIDESDETNNRMSRSIQIGPDLVISVFTVPATGAAGSSISISDTLLNQGGGTAAASTTTFYLSANGVIGAGDILLGSRNVPALAAGATHLGATTLTIPSTTGVGVYFIIANADANGAVVETIEINNTFGRTIQIGGDLAVSALTVPATGAAGSTIVATETTRNVGGASVAASATQFYLSSNSLLDAADILLGGRAVPSLGAGITNSGSTALPIPASTAPGAYYIIAKADADNVVPELYETNNTAARLFQIGSDLVISAMTVPAVAAPGAAVTVTETTSNQGVGLAPPSATRFYLSANAVLDSSDQLLPPLRQVPELAGNASSAGSTVVTIPAGTAPGAHYIIARADADNTVTETNETNNVLWRLIQIGGDLVVSGFTVPTKGGAGLAITVTDTTTNQGSGTLPATVTKIYLSSNVTYEAGDTLLGSRPVPQLAAGASSSGSTSVTIPAGVATGTYFVLARADADAAAVETQEANNVLARSIQIGSDLWVTTMTVPLKAAAGSSIVVTETTVNQGGGASTPSATRFYLSADGSIGAGDTLLEGSRTVPGLAPGGASTASTTVLIPAGAAPGTHYLIAKADADNAVAETLETNNTRSHSMSVGPDLVVSTVTVSATTVAAGSTVNVTDTVTNQGAGPASPSVTRFYLSQNIVVDAGDISLAASRAVPDIAGGASNSGTTSVTIPANTPPGSYFLLSNADGFNSVTEYLETNNVAPRAIQITLAP